MEFWGRLVDGGPGLARSTYLVLCLCVQRVALLSHASNVLDDGFTASEIGLSKSNLLNCSTCRAMARGYTNTQAQYCAMEDTLMNL